MARVTTQKELEAVLRLDGPARFEHFVKRVAKTLLDDLLPAMRERGTRVAVFPRPDGRGVVVTPEELEAALRRELEKYE